MYDIEETKKRLWNNLEELDEILVDYAEALGDFDKCLELTPKEFAQKVHELTESCERPGYAAGLQDIFTGLIEEETLMQLVIKSFKKGYELDEFSNEGR